MRILTPNKNPLLKAATTHRKGNLFIRAPGETTINGFK